MHEIASFQYDNLTILPFPILCIPDTWGKIHELLEHPPCPRSRPESEDIILLTDDAMHVWQAKLIYTSQSTLLNYISTVSGGVAVFLGFGGGHVQECQTYTCEETTYTVNI